MTTVCGHIYGAAAERNKIDVTMLLFFRRGIDNVNHSISPPNELTYFKDKITCL